MRQSIYNILILSFLCIILLVSCVKEELYKGDITKNTPSLNTHFNWPDEIQDRPDSMIILSHRVINDWRCAYVSTTKPDNNSGRYEFYGNDLQLPDDSIFYIKNGIYQFLAFSAHQGDSKTFKFNNSIKNYQNNISEGLHSFDVEYLHYTLKDKDMLDISQYWHDFNPYSDYIKPDADPAYYAKVDSCSIYSTELKGNSYNVYFSPREISQKICIRFCIETDPEVEIENIKAEISGIPYKINIFNGYLDIDTTYKLLFHVEPILPIEKEQSSKTYNYKGDINVLGIVPNSNPEYSTGGGILQLCISVKHTDQNSHVSTTRNLYSRTNLYHTLNKKDPPLLIMKDGHITQSKNIDTIDIEQLMYIKNDMIIENPNGDPSKDTWIQLDSKFDINLDV